MESKYSNRTVSCAIWVQIIEVLLYYVYPDCYILPAIKAIPGLVILYNSTMKGASTMKRYRHQKSANKNLCGKICILEPIQALVTNIIHCTRLALSQASIPSIVGHNYNAY